MTSFAAAFRRLDCLCLVVCICTVLSPFLTPIVEKIQLNPAGACMSAMGHCKLTIVSSDGVFVHAGPQSGRFSVIQSRR